MTDLANIVIYNDNLGAKKLTENPMFQGANTLICDIISFATAYAQDCGIEYVPTEDMVADMFTKGLPKLKHMKCLSGVGLDLAISF